MNQLIKMRGIVDPDEENVEKPVEEFGEPKEEPRLEMMKR